MYSGKWQTSPGWGMVQDSRSLSALNQLAGRLKMRSGKHRLNTLPPAQANCAFQSKKRRDLNATTAIGVFLAAHVAIVLLAVFLVLCTFPFSRPDEAIGQMRTRLFPASSFLSALVIFVTALGASFLINRERLTDASQAGAAWVVGKKSAICFCLALGLFLQSCVVFYGWLSGHGASEVQHIALNIPPSASPLSRVIWLLTVTTLGPLGEELLFRGIMYGGFYKSFGQRPAVVLTTLLFLCVHSQAYRSLHGFVTILTYSVALLWCRIRFKAVGPAIALHIALNATTAAIALFAPKADHTSPEVHNQRGQAYGEAAKYDKAIFEFSRAIELDSNNVEAYTFRGRAFLRKGAADKAIPDLNRSILLEPTNALAFHTRGQAYAKLGQSEKAISDFTRAIELDPDSWSFLYRAYAYEQAGDYPRAIADLYKSIQLAPNESTAYNDLAWLFATCDNPVFRNGKAAEDLARKACDLSEWKAANYMDTLAAAFAEEGDYKEAARYEEQAISLSASGGTNRLEMQKRLEIYRQNRPYRKMPVDPNGHQ